MEIISSRQNALVKHLIKLAESRRERLKSQQCLLIGTHLVAAAQAAHWPLEKLLVCAGHEDGNAEIQQLLQQSATPPLLLSAALFAEIEQTPSSTGLIALAAIPPAPATRRDGFCLLLEGVQDPGNVGTILRTAAAAGVDQVWLSAGCADLWSPKVLRAAMGAHFLLPVLERVDAAAAVAAFQGPLCITALDAPHSLYASDLRGSRVLALGCEGSGISAALSARAQQRLRIPMQAGVESLNVAAAAAVCLYERRRQLGMD